MRQKKREGDLSKGQREEREEEALTGTNYKA